MKGAGERGYFFRFLVAPVSGGGAFFMFECVRVCVFEKKERKPSAELLCLCGTAFVALFVFCKKLTVLPYKFNVVFLRNLLEETKKSSSLYLRYSHPSLFSVLRISFSQ